jgi:transcription elongation factor Elf1
MEELKDCPFCGHTGTWGDKHGKYFIWCTHCFAQTEGSMETQESVDAWNKRSNDVALIEKQRDELLEACKKIDSYWSDGYFSRDGRLWGTLIKAIESIETPTTLSIEVTDGKFKGVRK